MDGCLIYIPSLGNQATPTWKCFMVIFRRIVSISARILLMIDEYTVLMKLEMYKFIALIALLAGGLSCTEEKDEDDPNAFKWDYSTQQEEFSPVNPGTKSSYFKIDGNILSFAVPYLVGTRVNEYPSEFTGIPHDIWTIKLIMAKGVDVSRLAPVITLAPGATLTRIEHRISTDHYPPIPDDFATIDVSYTGIVEVGVYDFRYQVDFTVSTPDGSQVIYMYLAVAIGDVWPYYSP